MQVIIIYVFLYLVYWGDLHTHSNLRKSEVVAGGGVHLVSRHQKCCSSFHAALHCSLSWALLLTFSPDVRDASEHISSLSQSFRQRVQVHTVTKPDLLTTSVS